MTREPIHRQNAPDPDPRDRLIMALYAELKAERATREALEDAIRNGVVSREVLSAIVADPVPVVTSDDIAEIEAVLSSQQATAGRRAP